MIHAQPLDAGLFGAAPRFGDLCMHGVIDLRHGFERGELERALRATIADFPVLGRRYEPRFWRDCFVEVEGPISDAVHVVDDPERVEEHTLAWVNRSIVATRERQVRVVQLTRPGGGARIVLSVMHIAVDGGGMSAVGHVLGSYLYGRSPALPIEQRREFWRTFGALRWWHAAVLAKDLSYTTFQVLRAIASGRRDRPFEPSRTPETMSFRHVVLRGDEIERVRARFDGRKPSVNDLLLAALARVSAARCSSGPVGTVYTMDLRRYGRGPTLSASNSSTMIAAMLPREEIGDIRVTTRAIAQITAKHRRSLIGPAYALAPYVVGAGLPHALARKVAVTALPKLLDVILERAIVMTNVGRVDDGLAAFGDDIESLRVVGPSMRGLPAPAVVAFGFRGDVHLQLYGGPEFGAEALETLERELREALELGG